MRVQECSKGLVDIVDFMLLLKGHVKKHCVAGNVLLVHSSKIRELIMKA